jgi:hypothetical protein
MTAPDATPWDLWVLRAIDPVATAVDVAALRQARRRQAGWELAAFQRLLGGDLGLARAGRDLLARRPELAGGLIVSLHLGPYQFLLEPFLAAGLTLTVVLNRVAERQLRPRAEEVLRRLGHPGRLRWLSVEDPGAGRALLRCLREGGPALAFVDGNQGRDGLVGTRRHGVPYRLPGREIRVRTGLARLICRTGCPVHPICLRWADDAGGSVAWSAQQTQRWSASDDPVAVTHLLFDWATGEIAATPQQWTFWDMLAASASAFAPAARRPSVTPGLHADYRRAFRACLERAARTVRLALEVEAEVWPGDVLVDLTNDRFYSGEGLTSNDLRLLAADGRTLADLEAARGRDWVDYHGLRLCLLGLARLRGLAGDPTPARAP